MSVAFQQEKIHEGKNLKRIREILGIKQEALGQLCPSKFSQQRISEIENQWVIEEPTLQELAEALGVTVEFIRSFNEEKAIFNIQNNENLHGNATPINHSHQSTFNYNNSNEELVSLFKSFIEEDKVKTQAILDLNKMMADLAKEIKNLKEGK
jgi:transcriptional regulator with XRE-family HTH domain